MCSWTTEYMGHTMRKCVFGLLTAKSQIGLQLQAVWSGHSLSAYRIIGQYRMYEWRAMAWIILGFVCVEVLRPSQPNGVMSSAVSLPNHTFTRQAQSSKRLTSIVLILSPETDNYPSWISGRERMAVENISWSISTKECCRPRRGLNLPPPALQSDSASNWAT